MNKNKIIKNLCIVASPPTYIYLLIAGSGVVSLVFLILIIRSIIKKNLKTKTVIIFILALVVFIFLYWNLIYLVGADANYGELC